MKRSFFLASCAGVLVGALLTATVLRNRMAQTPPASILAADSRGNTTGLVTTFAPVVKKVVPAVVNISSTRMVKTGASGPGGGGNDGNLPMDEFFRRFFGGGGGSRGGSPFGGGPRPPTERRASSLGSGVLVSTDGYVLTNNHVVESATTVKVELADKREFTAKIIGTDPQTDIALLKIDGKNFPVVPMGDSSKVQVGDIALAVGDPFGIGQTVTMGIVSATSRGGLGIEDYEDFIQTDASINPGNSGGALVDVNGQLIAINTAILSGNTGGNQGIGFAIPINMAKEVMDQLTKTGKITRGYIGAGIQPITPALAKAFKVPDTGTVIREVEPNSPAAQAGLQAGDVVTAVDNVPVADSNAFILRISRTAPGTTLHLKVVRDGNTRDVAITPTKRPDQNAKNQDNGSSPNSQGTPTSLKGLSVDNLTPDVASQLHLNNITGVVVTDVEPGTPAAEAGLRSGDVIQHVNRHPVTNVKDFQQAIGQAGKDTVVFLVNRGGQTQFVAVEPS